MTRLARSLKAAETARRFKISTKALRLYEDMGLIRPPRTPTGWRSYGPPELARLHQVLALKSLGLSLKQIAQLIRGRVPDLDEVLRLQEAAFRARIAGDQRRLALLSAVRARLARGEDLSIDDIIQLAGETVSRITKTHDAFVREEEALAVIAAAGLHPLLLDVPPETSEDHWHDFDTMIFVLEGENVVIVAETGETLVCGPGTRTDFPRGAIHRERHNGYRGLYGLSVDPATLTGPVNMPVGEWRG